MNSAQSDSARKEKVLKMLASLTPKARMAVLSAAKELKEMRKNMSCQK